jgi:hypothetical protein
MTTCVRIKLAPDGLQDTGCGPSVQDCFMVGEDILLSERDGGILTESGAGRVATWHTRKKNRGLDAPSQRELFRSCETLIFGHL